MKKIKIILRKWLKARVKGLTQKALNKHDIEIIAIVGQYGTQIAREALYSILEDRYNVRRNVRPIWWDMSIPLTILGYEDKQYSIVGWVEILLKSIIAYIKNPSYKHKIIIEMDTQSEDIADYWGEFVHPQVLLLLNAGKQELNLLSRIIGESVTTIVYNYDDLASIDYVSNVSSKKQLKFGMKDGDIVYSYFDDTLVLKQKGSEYMTRISLPEFEITPLVGAITTSTIYENDTQEIMADLSKFELHPHILDKIYHSI